jgi:hypothetical protein
VVTGAGKLVEGFLTWGEVHDATVAGELGEDIAGCAVIADRGYGSNGFRRELEGNNNLPVIPGRRNRKKEIGRCVKKYDPPLNKAVIDVKKCHIKRFQAANEFLRHCGTSFETPA